MGGEQAVKRIPGPLEPQRVSDQADERRLVENETRIVRHPIQESLTIQLEPAQL